MGKIAGLFFMFLGFAIIISPLFIPNLPLYGIAIQIAGFISFLFGAYKIAILPVMLPR